MKVVAILILVLLFVVGCSESNQKSSLSEESVSSAEQINTTPASIKIEFAEHFTVESVRGGYLVQLLDPNSREVEASYELTFDKSKKGKNVIHLPVKNIAALSQTTVGMLSELKSLDALTGVSNMNYVYSPTVKSMFQQGKITEFGEAANFPVEKVVKSKTKFIIYSSFGDALSQEEKLNKFGVKGIPNYEWRETHPLGRAEWIKFLGVLLNKNDEAQAIFSTIKKKYEDLRWKIRDIDVRPTVLCGNIYGDTWFAPGGTSFMALLITDAGGNYRYAKNAGTGSIELSMERIVFDNRNTDIWINPGIAKKSTLKEMNPKSALLKAFTNHTYCYSHQMNKYWERSAIEPHLLLSDLIHIFHPDMKRTGKMHYYQLLKD